MDDIRVYDGRPLEVQLERGGTHLRLTSETLDADALVEIARSLGEVSTEPPSVF